MAKMFYTLEEASQKLSMSEEQVKQLAAGGKLQQFRDRDKLMFKRDQVDTLASQAAASGDASDKIDLAAEPKAPGRKDDPRAATGISVFDADEVEAVDPMAQTQISKAPTADEEELQLESVGSGSGLLDLTRESDDTSLGAELLDEIYPGTGGEASDAKQDAGTISGSGMLNQVAAEASGPSGLENLQGEEQPMATMPVTIMAEESDDPAGSGLGLGMLVVAAVALLALGVIGASAVIGSPSALASAMASTANTPYIYLAGGIVVAAILGAIGFFVGKAKA